MTEVAEGQNVGAKNEASAVALRLAGASYTEIAEVLGYASPDKAQQAVENHLSALADGMDPESRALLRATEGARLERLLRSVWNKATKEAHPDHLAAVRTALTLIDRRIRLYGLDAPTQIAVYSPTATEIDAWIASMTSQQASIIGQEPDIIVMEPIESSVVDG